MSSGKSGGAGQTNDYYGSIAGEVCLGQLDFIVGILVDDQLVWPLATVLDASQPWPGTSFDANRIIAWDGFLWTNSSTTSVEPADTGTPWSKWRLTYTDAGANPFHMTVPNYGDAYLYWGTSDQALDPSGEAVLDAFDHPPYRNRAALVLKNWKFGTERQTAPNASIIAGRNPVQSLITGAAADPDSRWLCNPWCVIAEILTHPVIGYGFANSRFGATSWQAAADWAYDRSAQTYIAPIYDSRTGLKSVIAAILSYADGFIYAGRDGKLEAGHWPHGEEAPALDLSTTITVDELLEEFQWDGLNWQDASNSTVVNFRDIEAAFQSRPATAPNLLNRAITRSNRSRNLDRPFIVYTDQASAVAAEDAKIFGQPSFSGTLTVRRERCQAITLGSHFLLSDPDLAVSQICRVKSLSLPRQPSDALKIEFESERGFAGQGYAASPVNPIQPLAAAPTRITNYQPVQMPSALSADGASHRIGMLLARNTGLTTSCQVYWKRPTSSGYQLLATQRAFGVYATMASSINGADVSNVVLTTSSVALTVYDCSQQDLWNANVEKDIGSGWEAATSTTDYTIDLAAGTVTAQSGLPDGSSLRISFSYLAHVTLDANTPSGDISSITAALTADEVADNTLLMFAFQAGNDLLWEVGSVKSVVATGGGNYDVALVREQYGTAAGGDGSHVWTSADRVFFMFRANIFPISHTLFATLTGSVDFRIAPATAGLQADVSDVYDSSTNPGGLTTGFTFTLGPWPA